MLGLNRRSLVEITVLAIFMTGEVVHSKGTWSGPCHFSFNAQHVLSCFQTDVTHLSPVLSPGVANDPVAFLVIISIAGIAVTKLTPSNNTNNVIGLLTVRVIGEHSTLVCNNWFGINGSSNGTTGKNFTLDGLHDIVIWVVVILQRDLPILGNRSIGEDINLCIYWRIIAVGRGE